MASNEADGIHQSNQLKVPLIPPNRSVLDRSREKYDKNIGYKAKFGRKTNVCSVFCFVSLCKEANILCYVCKLV